jgi:hypothetical protein
MNIDRSEPDQLIVCQSIPNHRILVLVALAALWGTVMGLANGLIDQRLSGGLHWSDLLCWWFVLLATWTSLKILTYRQLEQVSINLVARRIEKVERYLWGHRTRHQLDLAARCQVKVRRRAGALQVVLLQPQCLPFPLSTWSQRRAVIREQARTIDQFLAARPPQ